MATPTEQQAEVPAEQPSSSKQAQVLKCTDVEKLALLRNYDGFVFDLDGTIWKGNTLIEGCKEVLDLLRAQGKKIFFVTNNSSKSRSAYVTKMTKLGLTVKQEEVLGSSYAAAVFLQSHDIKKAYVVGEAGLVEELQSVGITALGGPADNAKAWDWGADADPVLEVDPEVAAVVVGLDRYVNYYKLQTAMTYLRHHNAIFVATNTDSHGNLAGSQDWAGAGTMVGAVSACSEMEPFVVGKPNSTLMDLVSKASGVTRNRLCVVGDRLDTDIKWAHTCGAGALLVLTGCTTEAMLQRREAVAPPVAPLLYVDSVGDLLSIKDKVPSSWGMDSCTVS